jgi:hypothetical protein
MELYDVSRRETRRTWAIALTLLVAIFIAGAPVVEAATQAVKVTNTPAVKIKDTKNGQIDAAAVGSGDQGGLGLLNAPASKGAVAVRTFGGGGGLINAIDCNAGTPRPNTTTVGANNRKVITGILFTGTDATVDVDAPALGALGVDILKFRANAANPNVFVGLGNGLTVTPGNLVFTCTGTDGEFVILGQ